MAYALGSSLLLLLLGLVTRRLLVYNFGAQISTASQVVTQLFNFFSIAEFGVGSVISYRLYAQIAAQNEEKISKYMSMYKWAYRAVGLAIAVLALLGAAALPWIMPDVPAATAYTVYALNVVSTLCSYFLVTRRLMYTCTQQGVPVHAHRLLLQRPSPRWPRSPSRCGGPTMCCISAPPSSATSAPTSSSRGGSTKTSPMSRTSRSRCAILRSWASSTTCGTTSYTGCPTRSTARPTPSSRRAWAARSRRRTWATTPTSPPAPPTSATRSWTALPRPSATSSTTKQPPPTTTTSRCSGAWTCSATCSPALWPRRISACSSPLWRPGWASSGCCP